MAAQRLESMLVAPLALDREQPLLIVPGGITRRVPWGLLEQTSEVDLCVAPSVWAYQQAAATGSCAGNSAAIVGPGLQWGAHQAERLGMPIYHDASVEQAKSVLATHDIVHVAAHGSFRSDNPLFSGLTLSDGPLTLYDLETMPRLAPIIVLAACDTASSASADHALVGLAPSVVGRGVASLIAPVDVVPDEATVEPMVLLQQLLMSGLTTSAALRQVRATVEHPAERATAGVFVCVGAPVAVSTPT